MTDHTIERLGPPCSDADLRSLGELLVETVRGGGVVTFLDTVTLEQATDWWRSSLDDARERACVLVAREGERIVGTVQFVRAWAPNQPHRAEILKLLVHPECRRSGLATRLMHAIEDEARSAGIRLLTLDTKDCDGADHLYAKLGYTRVGVIPDFAFDPDGVTPHGAAIYYKRLD